MEDKGNDHDEDINREKRKLEEVLEVYEQRLGETKFLAGNKFTLADLVHLPGTHHVITSERFAYLYDSRKNVQRWWNTISARDSWQQVLKDMKTVEEEHRKEELKKQQQQWQEEYLQQSNGREIHISHRQQEGTKSQTVLVPPPSTGTIITSIPTAPQEHETTSDHKSSSPIQRHQGVQTTRQIDPTTQKPPSSSQNTKSSSFQPSTTTTTGKTDQRTDSERPSQKGASTPSKTSQRPSNEADQDKSSSPAPKADVQDAQKQAKARPTEQQVSRTSPKPVEFEDTQDGTNGDERFSTKRLRRMFNPDAPGSQGPTMEEEAPVTKDPSGVHDREKQTTIVPANKMTSSPSTGTRAPYNPEAADERGDILPRKGAPYNDRATARTGYSQSIQQVPPPALSNDKLAKTEGVDMRAPQRAPQQTPTDAKSGSALMQGADPRARVVSDEQTKKNSTMGGRAPEATTRKASDSQGTSASVQEPIPDTRGKQAPVPGVEDTGESDINKKLIVGKRVAERTSGSQQAIEPAIGVSPNSPESLGDKSTIAAMPDQSASLPASVRTQPSAGQNASAVRSEGNLDESGKNKAAKPSPNDPRSMLPTTPGKLAPSPDTQIRTISGQLSKPSPELPGKTSIAGTSQTSVVSPNGQPNGQAPSNTGVPSSVPPQVKPPENNNKAYKEEAAEQQVARDQSKAQLPENKKQGDYAGPVTGIVKRKEEDSLANASGYSMGQAQAITTGEPSKLQPQSDQNKAQASKDGGKQTNETANSPTLATSKEVLPSPPEKSKQLQGDKSAISLQGDVKQGSEAASLGSGTELQRKKDLPTNADKNFEKSAELNSEANITSGTQQVKNNRSDSTSDRSIKPTQTEGNKDDLPESERHRS